MSATFDEPADAYEIISNEHLQAVCDQFQLIEGGRTIEPYGNGHINDTFLVVVDADGVTRRYILQRLNRYVFKRPELLMENIERVTQYLARRIAERGGDATRETLTLIPTVDGVGYYVDGAGDYFRVYPFIERTVYFDLPDSPELFERAAESFGNFQHELEDFPAASLHETIANFHNTPDRYRQLIKAIEADVCGRAESALEEIEFAKRYEREVHALIEAGLPLRVTHNDTKLNNILMDEVTGEGVCVIDLDTVMPGLAAYDFGDSIRTGANAAREDEQDMSKVKLSMTMFEAYARGYLRACGSALTQDEVRLLPMGAKLMTLECGMRFLTDYLKGDVYFKIHKTGHNLIRCRSQFQLVRDIEAHMDEMMSVIAAVKV